MAQATNYQCPACGGPLHFAGSSDKVECDYCGSSYEVSYINQLYGIKVEENINKEEKQPEDEAFADFEKNLKSYNCPSCGAQLFCDETTAATSCPYCGNNQVIASQFKGGKMPQVIIPFKLAKKDAELALKNHYKGKKLLPKVFSDENHIEEIKGVYVPFWLYDGHVNVNIDFTGTTSHVTYTSKEKIITTSHYVINRQGSVDFEKISVDASKKMDDALMDSIEPFDYSDLREFTPAYLPGFFAEVYDVSTEECFTRAKKRAENTAIDQITGTVIGYESLVPVKKDVKLHTDKISYAFMPVWVLSTKWRDKNYLFAMNGQTGKMVGNLPVDKGLFWRYFFGITALVTAICTPIVYFLF